MVMKQVLFGKATIASFCQRHDIKRRFPLSVVST